MRHLYEVFIVDPEDEAVVFRAQLVAKSPASVERKAALAAKLTKDVEEYDFITRVIGDVRPKKEVQQVEVIK